MIYPEGDRKQMFRALRVVKDCPGYPVLKALIEANIAQNMNQAYDTMDTKAVDRLLGANKAISELLQELEDSHKNELANANGESSSGISLLG